MDPSSVGRLLHTNESVLDVAEAVEEQRELDHFDHDRRQSLALDRDLEHQRQHRRTLSKGKSRASESGLRVRTDLDLEDGPDPRRKPPRRSMSSGGVTPAHERARRKQERRDRYWRKAAVNVGFILAWYLFSTCISVYNKWMFSPEHRNFGFPLFVTSIHMTVQFILAGFTLSLWPRLRPANKPSLRDYMTKAAPCGLATGLDIGLSNLSLKTITLSFYTMCKSSVLAFVLLFAFIFKLERPSWRLVGIIAIITVGVVLMVSHETKFNLGGMIEVLTASALGGLRWSLTQMLLDREAMGMNNPLATLFFLAPVMGASLFVCSAFVEGYGNVFADEASWGTFGKAMGTFGLIVVPGCMAFFMNVAEFGLIQRTSVVTLSVCGIFKEVATIFVGTVVFGDELTPINISGLCVTLFGIALFNVLKYRALTSSSSSSDGGHGRGGRTRDGGENGDKLGEEEVPMMRKTLEAPRLYNMAEESSLFLGEPSEYAAARRSISSLSSDEDDLEEEEIDPSTHLRRMSADARDQPPRFSVELGQKLREDPDLFRLEEEEDELGEELDARRRAGGGQ